MARGLRMLTDEDVWLERFKKNLETWEVREEAFLRWLDRKETFGKSCAWLAH